MVISLSFLLVISVFTEISSQNFYPFIHAPDSGGCLLVPTLQRLFSFPRIEAV